jgi:hypothetical protein
MGCRQPPPASEGLGAGEGGAGGREVRPLREGSVRETRHRTTWGAGRTLHGGRRQPCHAVFRLCPGAFHCDFAFHRNR